MYSCSFILLYGTSKMNYRILPCALFALAAFAQDPPDDRVYRIGNGVSPPKLIAKKEPDYSEEARRAKVSSIVALTLVVGIDGVPWDIKILRKSGFGLDEQSM